MKPARRLGCRAKFTAFSGISRPLANGVDGADGTDGAGTKTMKKVGVTLIVYEYEHNHDIRHLVATNKETDRSRDLRLSREKREELARHIKVLLARGFEIREVAQMLGANAKRCRELHMRGGNGSKGRRFGWKDYLTRNDVVKALELLQSIEAWGTQRSLDKESQVGDAEEESKEEAEIEEGEPAVKKKESEREVEKALEVDVDDDKVEEVSKEQWQMDILRKALKDLYCLKETSGLDPELDEDDPRLHGLGSSTDTNGQQRGSHIYTHPHLEVRFLIISTATRLCPASFLRVVPDLYYHLILMFFYIDIQGYPVKATGTTQLQPHHGLPHHKLLHIRRMDPPRLQPSILHP